MISKNNRLIALKDSGCRTFALLYLVAYIYLSSYHENAINALQRARFGVASHLSTTSKWGNPAKCLSQRRNNNLPVNLPVCSPHCLFDAERQVGKL